MFFIFTNILILSLGLSIIIVAIIAVMVIIAVGKVVNVIIALSEKIVVSVVVINYHSENLKMNEENVM